MYASFHTVGLPDISLVQAIEAIRKAGYTGIELNAETLPWAAPHITPDASPAERREARIEIAAAGLEVSAVGAHIPMLFSEAQRRRDAIDFVKGCNQLALDTGTRYVHILSGPAAKDVDRATNWRWFTDAVAEVVEHGAGLGVTVGIEAIAGHMFHAANDYALLESDLPGIPFKVNFDPSQLIVQGADPLEVIDRFGERIAHVHMKDGLGSFPDFAFPPLGQGAIDFEALVGRLHDVGFEGALSVEYEAQVFGYALTDEQILKDSRDFLTRLGV